MSRPRNATSPRLYGEQMDKGPVDLATVRLGAAPRIADDPVIGEIEVGMPVPPRPGRSASAVYQAVAELQVGQSRLFEGVDQKRLYGHVKRARTKGMGTEYAVRAIGDGHRVWRVS